ncbi:hypothetical protein [Streptomyces camponoticapitis]|uniref:hypothetical protein n=1 Tax=Streptomyces camponoticapitis TaxID=1616125 RepID=UPI001E4E6CE7|nr:hypothetical protein [Streptomyces camponoticapitis]
MVDGQNETAVWDPDEITISVQRGTHPHDLIMELRALLSDLGAPTTGAGLRCFCGDPIELPTEPDLPHSTTGAPTP